MKKSTQKNNYKQYLNRDGKINVSDRTLRRWKKFGYVLPEGSSKQCDINAASSTSVDAARTTSSTCRNLEVGLNIYSEDDSSMENIKTKEQKSEEADVESSEDEYMNLGDDSSTCSDDDNPMENTENEEHNSEEEREEETVYSVDDIDDEILMGTDDEMEELPFIFENSKLTQNDIFCMVHALSLRHQLSAEARKDIIDLIKICAGANGEEIKGSKYAFSKYFDAGDDELTKYFYCEGCYAILDSYTELCEFCDKEQSTGKNYFILVDPRRQLTSILTNTELINISELQDENVRNNNKVIRDVFDGKIYKNSYNKINDIYLTYTFSTDGAPVFKSSRSSMWPIQFIINEIPPKERFRKSVFAGLWVGKGEPGLKLMNLFMKTFTDKATEMFTSGIKIKIKEKFITTKLLPLLCSVDSVARPVLQNRMQFNGKYGCSWCYHPGEIIEKTMKYPCIDNVEIRSSQSHQLDITSAELCGKPVRGVKFASPLIDLPLFDIVWGFPCEYMHGVLLGVTKQMLELWTTYTPESRHKFYIGRPKVLETLNNRLMKIQPPNEIHRLPRPISEKAKWKASEWRSFLLFYALPCLDNILGKVYLKHFALLVVAIFRLLKEEISENDLIITSLTLQQFVNEMEILYGKKSMTFNVHTLLHYVESVKRCGPLWATSTFPFESEIFTCKNQVKGPSQIALQICKKMCNTKTFINNIKNYTNNDTAATYCKNLYNGKYHCKKAESVDATTFLGLGNLMQQEDIAFLKELSEDHTEDLRFCFSNNIIVYNRCIHNGILLHTVNYTKTKKRNNCIVNTKFGYVQILKVFTNGTDNFMYVNQISVKASYCENILIPHVHEVTHIGNACILSLNSIIEKCMLITLTSKQYVVDLPNVIEVQ